MIALLLLFVLGVSGGSAAAARPGDAQATAAPPAAKADLLDITLERRKNGKVEPMATGHVFQAGDVIRMRLNSHFVGFLYVMNQGTSGKFTTVFPAADTGNDNRVTPDKVYLVPATEDGWFEVQGPAGFDTLYFLLSPTALATPSVANFVSPAPASSLKPRCDDKIYRAIGECTDRARGGCADGCAAGAAGSAGGNGFAGYCLFKEEGRGYRGGSRIFDRADAVYVSSGAPVAGGRWIPTWAPDGGTIPGCRRLLRR